MKKATAEWLKSTEMDNEELCNLNDNIPSFSWHIKILKDREKLISKGKATFLVFNEAKARIQEKIQQRQ